QHLVAGIGAEAIGQHRAGRAGADDNEVKARLVHFSPRGSRRPHVRSSGERGVASCVKGMLEHIPFGWNQPNGMCLLQQATPVGAFPRWRNRKAVPPKWKSL